LLLLWAITGGAVATAIIIRIWLLDPPSGLGSRFTGLLAAGIIGGVTGGGLANGVASSDPMPIMPTLVGAAAGGLMLAGAAAVLGKLGPSGVRGR
jgi:hypothetical protein